LKGKPAPKIPYSYSWDGYRPLPIVEAGMVFSGERIPRAKADLPFDDAKGCFCDAGKLRFPLLVRSRKEGDRFRPLGAPGRKKLKEIFRAKGIPLYARDRLPVFCSEGKIIWVPGLPVAEDFKITARTRTAYCLKKSNLLDPVAQDDARSQIPTLLR
jgi:tRNA(Ile)-lysidine synthase